MGYGNTVLGKDIDMNLCINGEMAYECKRNPYYFITKSGRVYSIYKVGGQGSVDASYPHELRYGFDRDGYKRVVLSLYGHKRYVKVHTLVAEQFIGDVVSPYTVNHIDGNKTNNDVTNLEIVTGADNTRHAHTTGLTTREVQVRVEHDGVVKTYRSIIECVIANDGLSRHYLEQLRRGIVLPSMVWFKKRDPSKRISPIDAYYNGQLYRSFDNMQDASAYFGMSRGAVSAAIKDSTYRERVNRYTVSFPSVSTIESAGDRSE